MDGGQSHASHKWRNLSRKTLCFKALVQRLAVPLVQKK
jgi:hypothetical protein